MIIGGWVVDRMGHRDGRNKMRVPALSGRDVVALGMISDAQAAWLYRHCRVVVNAATRDKDLAWIDAQAKAFGVEVTERLRGPGEQRHR